MHFNRNIPIVLFLASVALGSSSCFSAPTPPCERIQEYYDKTNSAIKSDLESNRSKLDDAEEFSKKCEQDTLQKIINTTQNGKSVALDGNEMKETAKRVRKAVEEIREADEQQRTKADELKNFNFAIGIGTLYLLKNPDIINTTVDNGVIRTTTEEKYKLGVWLSTNSFLEDHPNCGFFTAVQLGGSSGNDILTSFAIGVSFRNSAAVTSGTSGSAPLVFQFGYGLTHIQTYANGYSDGMSVPTGSNQPLMKKTISKGPALIVSTAFK